jgi:A/G-specific adenine glycosylase
LNKGDKIKFIQKELLKWYKTSGRHFPWRNKSISTYQKVIVEVLLQRTKAETVSKFFKQFVKDYPNWQSLAAADVKEIEEYLKPIVLK